MSVHQQADPLHCDGQEAGNEPPDRPVCIHAILGVSYCTGPFVSDLEGVVHYGAVEHDCTQIGTPLTKHAGFCAQENCVPCDLTNIAIFGSTNLPRQYLSMSNLIPLVMMGKKLAPSIRIVSFASKPFLAFPVAQGHLCLACKTWYQIVIVAHTATLHLHCWHSCTWHM